MHATTLETPVQYLPGIGQRRATLLQEELGIQTCGDLLLHVPFRYIDRSKVYRIGDLTEEMLSGGQQYVQLRARVREKRAIGQSWKARLSVVIEDDSGSMEVVWFRGAGYMGKRLEVGCEYLFFGRPTFFNGTPNMVHPEFEAPMAADAPGAPGVQGVYSTSERLSGGGLGAKAFYQAIRNVWPAVEGQIEETLPEYLLSREKLVSRRQALHDIHFPADAAALQAAQRRLKFEELFLIQLQLLRQKRVRTVKSAGYLMPRVGEYFNMFYKEKLPFALTGAQQRVVKEIRADMVGGHQMTNRAG